MGTLAESAGTAVVLKDARRLFRWADAATLSEISVHGCGETSRISQPVKQILLTQAIEIIPCEPKAIANLTRSRNL